MSTQQQHNPNFKQTFMKNNRYFNFQTIIQLETEKPSQKFQKQNQPPSKICVGYQRKHEIWLKMVALNEEKKEKKEKLTGSRALG